MGNGYQPEETVLSLPPDASASRFRVSGLTGRLPRKWVGALLPVVFVIVWELLSRAGLLAANWFPAPLSIAGTLVELLQGGELFHHIGITVARVVAGFLIGAVLATLLAGIAGSTPLIRELVDPTIQALRNIPSMAWVPLFLLWLGIHESSKIALIAVGVFFPVYLNLLSGILNVDRKLIEVGHVYRLNKLQLVRRVILPAALPAFLVGLRSGLGLGWMFVVAAEIMGASKGLGFLMIDGQMTGRASVIIASIVLFALFGKLTDLMIERCGNRLLRQRGVGI
ncbi:ABC transporter permease [Pelotalea chapellei]|uniref:ABC transporter permease n=1 Tax=Pelotalea chapellei TaxID=44671 RepID=A0ABS5U4D4_9BACT|nr:ABC transporter permease [Pelotalea chapellei]MBT1070512.1 ABC transporter permease [Pelotalea chapellei]